ncbi:MAG: hypothetical protein ABEJ61_05585 [Haloferacaceae archaeon]
MTVDPGVAAEIPVRVTNTSSETVPAGDAVLSADVREFLPVTRRGTGPRDGWGAYAGETLWRTPTELPPGASAETVLPVAASTPGLYRFELDGVSFPTHVGGGATGTADLVVEPVPADLALDATLVGVARTPDPQVDTHHANLAAVACPGGPNVATVYVGNRGRGRARETTVSIRTPWGEPSTRDVGAVDPGRYAWYQTDLSVPADVSTGTTHDVTVTVETATTSRSTAEQVEVRRRACRRTESGG